MVYRQSPHGKHTDLEDRDAQLSQSLFANVLAPLAPHLAFESKQPVPSCIGFGSLWWMSELESALLRPRALALCNHSKLNTYGEEEAERKGSSWY